jgi:pimeloyl-ACP methyl ester carboxylesterase
MTDFVLVHGAWHGAWCWRHVQAPLCAAGHRVFAVTLSGVGERAHLGPQGITLATHVQDVAAVIEAEELRDAVLVGHSYAGMVITGVADRLAGAPSRPLACLAYLDAVVPRPGESWSSTHDAETQRDRRAAIARAGVIAPPADLSNFGLVGEARDWVARHLTPQPGGVYDAPLQFDAARVASLRRVFIDCNAPALATIATSRERVRTEPGWTVVEIATGHDAMASASQALARALLELA